MARAWSVALALVLLGAAFPAEAQTGPLPPDVARFFSRESSPPEAVVRIIEGIEILGNDRTVRGFILAQLRIAEGELVDESAIEVARIRLLSTGFFRSVSFHLQRGSERGKVLLVVTVQERSTLQLENIAFGFGPGNVPFFAAGLSERNFLGRGVSVGGVAAVGEGRRALELRLFVPSLSGTRLQLAASALWLVGREFIEEAESAPQLEYERLGGTLGLGFGSGPAQRISLVYRLEAVTTESLPNLDPALLRRAPSILADASVLSTLTATWERDTRNDAFAPSRGTRWALSAELGSSILGSDYEFSKYIAEVEHAVSVFRSHALLLRGFGGLIQGEAPFFAQFFRRDFTHFSYGAEALPRAVQLNFSTANDYDDLLANAGVTYLIPIAENVGWVRRILLYVAADFTVTRSLAEAQDDASGREAFDFFPLSVDGGLKLDTQLGRFDLSLAYAADLL